MSLDSAALKGTGCWAAGSCGLTTGNGAAGGQLGVGRGGLGCSPLPRNTHTTQAQTCGLLECLDGKGLWVRQSVPCPHSSDEETEAQQG